MAGDHSFLFVILEMWLEVDKKTAPVLANWGTAILCGRKMPMMMICADNLHASE